MNDYDAVVVGARCAGAATAMLLARAGARVLLLDRERPGRDTLSTHALLPGAVLQLRRWGLLDAVAAASPAITSVRYFFGDTVSTVDLPGPLHAPRRTVLDPLLVDAARDAGATVRSGVDVTGVLRDRGRVVGVVARGRGSAAYEVRAPLVIGADGRRSTVAHLVDAPVLRRGRAASAVVYGYWPLTSHSYELFYRPGLTGGIIPTGGGLACVWVALPAGRFRAQRDVGLDRLFARTVARVAPTTAALFAAPRTGPLRGFPGMVACLRRATGPGWALVGDAANVKDPLTAHGITDALRDAELLVRAVVADDLDAYAARRDALAYPLLDVAEKIAGYDWTLEELPGLLRAEDLVRRADLATVAGFDAPGLASAA
ncbi:NAD(P)/FAD-dependent oxidoreductase [Pseudonocardia sp.]|uniref:NAD(P)/FAD-dependent oxidoreductase n=1 Tax=Pseudonocardia sp. TaxID=60912 RepID=UPI003D14483D